MYYVSIIRLYLEYAAAVLFNMSGQCSTVLETLQNRCLRIVALATPRTNTNLIRKIHNILTLQARRQYIFLCEFYRLHMQIVPPLEPIALTPATPHSTLRSTTNCGIYMPRWTTVVEILGSNHIQLTTDSHKDIQQLVNVQNTIKASAIL